MNQDEVNVELMKMATQLTAACISAEIGLSDKGAQPPVTMYRQWLKRLHVEYQALANDSSD